MSNLICFNATKIHAKLYKNASIADCAINNYHMKYLPAASFLSSQLVTLLISQLHDFTYPTYEPKSYPAELFTILDTLIFVSVRHENRGSEDFEALKL